MFKMLTKMTVALVVLALLVGECVLAQSPPGSPAIYIKNKQWKNIKDYGAIGDGVAADRTAIQAAINAVSDSGGIVYFPAASVGYVIDAPLVVPSNVTLQGAGKGSRLKMAGASTRAMIINEDSTAGNTGIVIAELYLDGGKSYSTYDEPDSADAISLKNVSASIIRDCWITGTDKDAIALRKGSVDCEISGNVLWNLGEDGITISGATSKRMRIISNNITGRDTTYKSGAGLIPSGILCKASESQIIGNTIRGGGAAIDINREDASDTLRHVIVSGNIIIGAHRTTISIADGYDIRVANNTLSGCSQRGMFLWASSPASHDIQITGNSFYDQGAQAIYQSSGSHYLIADNLIFGSDSTAIYVAGDWTVVTGNKISGTDALYGIHLASSRFSTVSNNIVYGANSYGIYLEGGAGGEYVSITGNAVSKCIGYGLYVLSHDFCSITGNTFTDNDSLISGNGGGLVLFTSFNNVIADNVSTSPADYQSYGMVMGSSGKNIIHGNQFGGNLVGDINGSSGDLLFGNKPDTSSTVRFYTENRIGIGTENPSAHIEIKELVPLIRLHSDSADAALEFYFDSTGQWLLKWENSDSSFVIRRSGAADVVTFTKTGKVIVGDTAGTYRYSLPVTAPSDGQVSKVATTPTPDSMYWANDATGAVGSGLDTATAVQVIRDSIDALVSFVVAESTTTSTGLKHPGDTIFIDTSGGGGISLADVNAYIDSTQLDTIQNAHKAVLADSTLGGAARSELSDSTSGGAARAEVADSALRIDTTYTPFQAYVTNHAGAGGGMDSATAEPKFINEYGDTVQAAETFNFNNSVADSLARVDTDTLRADHFLQVGIASGPSSPIQINDTSINSVHRITGDVDGGPNAVDIQIKTMTTGTTEGVELHLRSADKIVFGPASSDTSRTIYIDSDTLNGTNGDLVDWLHAYIDSLIGTYAVVNNLLANNAVETDTIRAPANDTLHIEGGGGGNPFLDDTLDANNNDIINVNKITGDTANFTTYLNAPSLEGDTITANVAKVNWIFPKDSAMVVIGDTGAATVWVFDSDTIRFNTTQIKQWVWGAVAVNWDLWDSLWNNVGNFRTGSGGSGSEDTTIFNDGSTEYSTINNRIKVKEGANINLIRQDSTSYDVITIGVTGSVPLSDSTNGGAARAELADSTTGGAARAELADSTTGGAARAELADSTTGGAARAELADSTLRVDTSYAPLVTLANKRRDSALADIRDTLKAVLYNTEYVNLSASMIHWTSEPMKAVAKFLTWPWIDTTTTYSYPDSLFRHAYLYRAYDTTANNDSLFTVIRWQADKACSLLSVIWCGKTSSATASTSSLDSTILYINTTKREGLVSQLASTALDTITTGLTGHANLAINAGDLVTIIFRHVIGNDAYVDCKWATITRKPR